MKTLKLNDQNDDVLTLTALLQKRGFLSAPFSVFDKTVQNAVKLFQAAHVDAQDRPLVPDGVVGPVTWWALNQDDISHVVSIQTPPPAPTGTSYGATVVAVALEEMHAGAKEIGGDNSGPFIKKYLNGLSPEGVSWCAAFNSYCNKEASKRLGVAMPFEYTLGAKDTHKQFQKKGWAYKASEENPPEPGDIIVFNRGDPSAWTGHIGMVYKYEHGILTTIEGNRGSFPAPVRTFTYTLSNIQSLYGFGRAKV